MAGPVARASLVGLSRNSFLLAASSLFTDISTEMLYPVLPVFLTQTLQASGSIVGLIDGVAQAAQNIVQGISGTVSDKLAKHKNVALVGYALAAVAKPLMGLATAWPWLFAGRLLDRVGTGTRSAPRDALVAASVEEPYRGKAFGLEGLGDNTGAFLGPLVTVLLLSVFGFGLRTVFYLAVIPGLLAFLLVLLVRETPATAQAEASIDTSLARFPRQYWRYLGAMAVFGIGNSSNAFLLLRMQDDGVALDTTILIYAAFNLVAALASYPAGALSDRWGRKRLLIAAFAIFALAYAGFAADGGVVVMGACFVFYGLHQGILRAVGKSLAADLAPPHLRASGIGWYSATIGVLQFAASLLAGALWDRVSHGSVFVLGAASAVLACIAASVLVPSVRHRQG